MGGKNPEQAINSPLADKPRSPSHLEELRWGGNIDLGLPDLKLDVREQPTTEGIPCQWFFGRSLYERWKELRSIKRSNCKWSVNSKLGLKCFISLSERYEFVWFSSRSSPQGFVGSERTVSPSPSTLCKPWVLMACWVKWESTAATLRGLSVSSTAVGWFWFFFFPLLIFLPLCCFFWFFFCTACFSLRLLWHQWQMSVRNCLGPVWLSKDKTICYLASEQFIAFLIIVISLAGGAMRDIFTAAKDAGTSFATRNNLREI